jgi:hypothetical protein
LSQTIKFTIDMLDKSCSCWSKAKPPARSKNRLSTKSPRLVKASLLGACPRNRRYFVWRPPDPLAVFQGASEALIFDHAVPASPGGRRIGHVSIQICSLLAPAGSPRASLEQRGPSHRRWAQGGVTGTSAPNHLRKLSLTDSGAISAIRFW